MYLISKVHGDSSIKVFTSGSFLRSQCPAQVPTVKFYPINASYYSAAISSSYTSNVAAMCMELYLALWHKPQTNMLFFGYLLYRVGETQNGLMFKEDIE